MPSNITTDKNVPYKIAIEGLKKKGASGANLIDKLST